MHDAAQRIGLVLGRMISSRGKNRDISELTQYDVELLKNATPDEWPQLVQEVCSPLQSLVFKSAYKIERLRKAMMQGFDDSLGTTTSGDSRSVRGA